MKTDYRRHVEKVGIRCNFIMEGLGIDFRLVLIQTTNFLILFLILKKWVYPPFIKFLEARALKIKESLEASEKMRTELKSFEVEKELTRKAIATEAQKTIEKSRSEAQEEKEKIIREARVSGEKIVTEAKVQGDLAKERSIKEAQQTAIDLALELSKKVLGQVDEAQARRLIKQSLEKAGQVNYEKSRDN